MADEPRARLLAQVTADVGDPRVVAAMAAVPRDAFVPADVRDHAWDDVALPIGRGQTISQPSLVARMCALLALGPRDRVLDVGTGSGYHAAVMARLAGHVWSVERHAGLSARAAVALRAAGLEDRVTLIVGDGCEGHRPAAPYDAVNVAAGATAVPLPLVQQLGRGGRMIIPVDDELLLLRRDRHGGLTRQQCGPVRFVPLVGAS